jgi:TRAP-type C4-dicarboxylate transport system substrate-binding protein
MTAGLRRGAFSIASLLAAAVLVATPARAGSIVVKMATLVPQGSSWFTTVQEMAQAWKTASGGAVTLRVYPGGVAGDEGSVVRKMRLGTLDAGLITAAGLADIDRSVFALELPMAYESYDEFDYVLDKLSPYLEKVFAGKGFIVLNWADAGWVQLFTKEPVRTPDDLKKLKLFTWAGDTPTVELWQSAGFNPVPLPSTEVSTALQTGLVTALPTTPQAAVLLQWYRTAPYMTDVKWGVLLGATVITTKSWDEIPAGMRPALLKAAREAGRKLTEQTRAAAVQDVKAMEQHGLTVVHVDPAAAQAWYQAATSAYPKARGSFVPGEAFDLALKYRDAYRAQHGEKASP